jgi:hypothetical protein
MVCEEVLVHEMYLKYDLRVMLYDINLDLDGVEQLPKLLDKYKSLSKQSLN